MRILLFIDGLGSGGAQRQMVYLANLLEEDGNEVRIMQYTNQHYFANDLSPSIKVIEIIAKSNLDRIRKVKKEINRNWQDVLISFLETPNFLANFSAKRKRKWALITSERNSIESEFRGFKNKIYKHFERKSDYLVCNSYSAKKLWDKHKPNYSNKVVVIHNCVDNFSAKTNETIINNPKIICVPASFKKEKNIFGLIEGLKLLSEEEKQLFKIHWYGADNKATGFNTLEDVNAQIKKYELSNTLVLFPSSRQIIDKMQKADIVGLFSIFEGLPNAILEGLSVGKPILMSEVSDYDYLVNSSNGVTFNPLSPDEIAKAIIKIVTYNDKELINMGFQSKIIANELFSKETFIKNWKSIINKALEKRSK